MIIGLDMNRKDHFTELKVGDKVRIKGSGKTGVIKAVFESGYWNIQDNEYSVEMDDGSGAVTIVEKLLEVTNAYAPKCICGLKFARSGGRHSPWCNIKED